MKKWIKENASNICLISVYAIVTLVILLFHEPWRDEAQAWLIARDLNITELIAQMKYEGHFLIWYLILMPFAKLGFPYITNNIISWLITVISAWLMLKKAPFKKWKTALFIFTFPMIYLFPVISRTYCLIPLAITLMAIFYKDRKTKPIRYILSIALLANTHVIMLGMVGILLLEFYIEQFKARKTNTKEENKRILQSLVIIVILLLLSAIPLVGCLTTNKDVGIQNTIYNRLINIIIIEPNDMINGIYPILTKNAYNKITINVLIVIIILFEIINHKIDFLEMFLIILWQYIIYAFIYSTSYQRAGTVVFIAFFFMWVRKYKTYKKKKDIGDKIENTILIMLTIIDIIAGIIFVRYEILYNYSSAYQVAEVINSKLEKGSIMVTGNQPEFCSAIIPYTKDTKFYYIVGDRYFSFSTWDDATFEQLDENFLEKLKEKFGTSENLYYIFSKHKLNKASDEKIVKKLLEDNKLEKVFETEPCFFAREEYIVYKINY